tara:strand:- start:9168 stop:9401 length:234 start_codon:yes stop_codon:yes gene_type:complete
MSTKKVESPSSRSGIRSSEFWLSSITAILGIVLASGAVDLESSSTVSKIVGGAVSILAALGYTVSRSIVKKADAENQ